MAFPDFDYLPGAIFLNIQPDVEQLLVVVVLFQHFLAAEVRYELKDKDKLTFGDVECSYHRSEQVCSLSTTGICSKIWNTFIFCSQIKCWLSRL